MQFLGPAENGKYEKGCFESLSLSNKNRSGIKSSGLGKYTGSLWSWKKFTNITTPGGIMVSSSERLKSV